MNRYAVICVLVAAIGGASWLHLAGTMEPPGPPGPTMRTLEEIPGSWHRALPADDGDAEGCNSSRFQCVLGGEAVLDRETGLVWQREPGAQMVENFPPTPLPFETARLVCNHRCYTGGRRGWRSPTIEELASLIDIATWPATPVLPAGHPFVNVQPEAYWSSTRGWVTGNGQYVDFSADPTGPAAVLSSGAGSSARYWCVRGQPTRDVPSYSY